ncbi:MAG TPA: phosphoglycerate kinase [Thermodesulfobacteriota bacterium]|nr:phosphoglycerate kinase [Thermodesulfobacteriota bacterium]
MEFKSIDQMDLSGKRLFLRADFNVPLDSSGNITDDNRIQATLPTINYALSKNAKVILASHLGRPKGKPEPQYSLAPVARRLSQILKKDVKLAPDCIGPEVEKIVAAMKPGDVVLLENLRFHKEEEKNDPGFAQALARLSDIYVNDAFAVSHRAHASVEGITKYVPQKAAGFLMKEELHYLGTIMENPARPLAAVTGGAKVSGKLEVLQNLSARVDKLIIGGGMAFTFLKAKGMDVGKSLVEDDLVNTAREILEKAGKKGVKVYLPVDCVAAEKIDASAKTEVVPVEKIPSGWMGLDIGPATIQKFREALSDVKTVVWNGPMGVFEMEPFSKGTMEMVRSIVSSGAVSVVGGGDTDTAVHKSGQGSKISYISTAGGAFLELLEGKKLPGVEALRP